MKAKRLLIFANDPLKEYCKKGELVERYFNPCDFFDEVCFISLSEGEVDADKIQHTAGRARVRILSIGKIAPWIFFPFSKIREKILEITKEFQPDCIRAYNAHVQGFLGASLSSKLSIPLVVSLHINPEKDIRTFLNPFISPARWLFWNFNKYFIEPFVLNKASKIICAYNFIYEFAKSLCKDYSKIEVIYNRIDMDQFKPVDRLNRNYKDIKILCVGRLFERKNPEYLIRAMPNINARLLIIGDGPYSNRIKKLIAVLSLDGKVSFIPSVPNPEINKYYQEADIFVSVNDYGGVSKVIIEAMASGLPIVITQPLWELHPELLEGTGIVIKNSSDSFIEALNQLIASSSLRADLGKRNREKALEINGRAMEEREMWIYRDLIYKK